MRIPIVSIEEDEDPASELVVVTACGVCGEEQSPDPVTMEFTFAIPLGRAREFYVGQVLDVDFTEVPRE